MELVSTGGTARVLRDAGLTVRDISDLTGFPEMLDGRVKTLHPKVHGGILHVRSNPDPRRRHRRSTAFEPIDMVVVNLYAFEKTAGKPGVHFEEIIENIDIGGPSMVRSAAKNFQDVAIVTSPPTTTPSPRRWSSTAASSHCKPTGGWRRRLLPPPPPMIPPSPTPSPRSASTTPAHFDISQARQHASFPADAAPPLP